MAVDIFASESLAETRAALVDTVKRAPGDQGARMFLWQVMALQGDWEKAQAQLRALASLSGEAQMLATVYSQAIAAEAQRGTAYAGRAPFPVLVASSSWIEGLARSLHAADGERLRDEAFDEAGETPGELNGKRFGWIADVDSRLGPAFEAIVGGKYGLIPFEAVSRIKTEGPRDLRDLVWLPVEMALRSGQSAAALLPARYPGSETSKAEVQLGRTTVWEGNQPRGQRVWTVDDGSELGLLELRDLVMA